METGRKGRRGRAATSAAPYGAAIKMPKPISRGRKVNKQNEFEKLVISAIEKAGFDSAPSIKHRVLIFEKVNTLLTLPKVNTQNNQKYA
jgi:hypothetical protein